MTVANLTMNDGHTIPQLGFGVFQVPPEDTAHVVGEALRVGYRHIDTAEMYQNEQGVGEGIRAAELPREEVFITSKLNNTYHRPDDARRAFAESLTTLGMEYVDLFLIHWPLPTRYDGDFVATWQTLIEFQREGRARSIGVSNFEVAHLARLAQETDVVPAVNQIEVHPFLGNEAVRSANAEAGILTEAWSPIARGKVAEDPVITAISERLGRTPAQVTLAWHLQRGDIVFPKTTHPERMAENFAIFDIELSAADLAAITALDCGEDGRMGPNPNTFDWIG